MLVAYLSACLAAVTEAVSYCSTKSSTWGVTPAYACMLTARLHEEPCSTQPPHYVY